MLWDVLAVVGVLAVVLTTTWVVITISKSIRKHQARLCESVRTVMLTASNEPLEVAKRTLEGKFINFWPSGSDNGYEEGRWWLPGNFWEFESWLGAATLVTLVKFWVSQHPNCSAFDDLARLLKRGARKHPDAVVEIMAQMTRRGGIDFMESLAHSLTMG